ncbi:hypothetical protein KEM48_000334 [Puccinia striiformis f. sp. tritici PST-130]|nr:hypothetical protein KEM48_000334 [Puccinia striiformis f. sp. tritici PST-130]
MGAPGLKRGHVSWSPGTPITDWPTCSLSSIELFVAPPLVKLQRLQFWAQPGGVYIIANLPGVLGYKQPVAVPSKSSMMKSVAKCFQQFKAKNVLLGKDGDCFIGEQFVNRACLRSRKATGNSHANNRADTIDVLLNPDHPLFVMINSTSDPIRGSWTRLKNTIRDICGLMHGHQDVTLLDNLRGVNGVERVFRYTRCFAYA